MHHAAMANKKEMMFTLARLGCDWRSRAEGIDGTTMFLTVSSQRLTVDLPEVYTRRLLGDPNESLKTQCVK